MTVIAQSAQVDRPKSAAERLRDLSRTDPVVNAAFSLHRQNGLGYVEMLETLVLSLAEQSAARLSDLVRLAQERPPMVFALPDRDDDDHCLQCGLVECAGHAGGAA